VDVLGVKQRENRDWFDDNDTTINPTRTDPEISVRGGE